MKLIDNNGRIFGKLNLFDLIVILLIVVGIVAVVLRGSAPAEENEAKNATAIYTYLYEGVQDNMANAFKKGDEIYENGKLLGVLVEEPQVKPYQTLELMPDGTSKLVDHKLLYSTTLTLKTETFSDNKGYHVNGNEMLNGTGHIISNGLITVNVVVTDIQQQVVE